MEQTKVAAVIVSLKVLYRLLAETVVVLRTAIRDLGGDPNINIEDSLPESDTIEAALQFGADNEVFDA